MTMSYDPIVEEIRKNRKELSARFDFDIKKLIEDVRSRQSSSGHHLVSFAHSKQKVS